MCYNFFGVRQMMEAFCLLIFLGGIAMKVNPITAKFVLELIAAITAAASFVVEKYYLEEPKD